MIRLFEWDRYRYVPSRLQVSPEFAHRFESWFREHNGISGTATVCRLDCGAGCSFNGDDELRLFRGKWTPTRFARLARLITEPKA
jgi:hypothetical protein